MSNISYRFLSMADHDALHACEEVQMITWRETERDVVPLHQMVAIILHGGHVLAAFDGERLVGFLMGYPGYLAADDPRARWLGARNVYASQMLGIIPEYQTRGLGYRMKVMQREAAFADGFRLATWTFDPLLSLNAHFNVSRLGAISRNYIRNIYGDYEGLYGGLPTDRLEVEWWLASRRVGDRLTRSEAGARAPGLAEWDRAVKTTVLNPASVREDGLAVPDDRLAEPAGKRLKLHIPVDIYHMKSVDMGLARAWRASVRAAFEAAFAAGYAVTWFASGAGQGSGASAYILTKDLDVPAMAQGVDG
jgi:predicted GNAT superfamily acetyltransferase